MEKLAKKAHVANNSGENEWYTPAPIIEAARNVMGGIDVDPASSDVANKTVQAATYYTKDDDGLTKEWVGSVWMNPPYAQPLIRDFSETLVSQYKNQIVTQAIVLVNNATETAWFQSLAEAACALCFPSGRIRFLDPSGVPGAPLQGQAIIGLGVDVLAFYSAFSDFGFCVGLL
jgi:ParB family chromosome partitioning protein